MGLTILAIVGLLVAVYIAHLVSNTFFDGIANRLHRRAVERDRQQDRQDRN